MGCDGLAARCAAHSIHQTGRGFASVFMSPVQHAGADATSDSALGALQRNGFGAGDSLLTPPRRKSFNWTPTLGDSRSERSIPAYFWSSFPGGDPVGDFVILCPSLIPAARGMAEQVPKRGHHQQESSGPRAAAWPWPSQPNARADCEALDGPTRFRVAKIR